MKTNLTFLLNIVLTFIFSVNINYNLIAVCKTSNIVINSSQKRIHILKIPFVSKHYICYRADRSIKIDGRLDGEIWEKAIWTDDFVDIEGHIKPQPRFSTKVKMLWDDEYLYIAAELEEPDIWATLKERESILYNDNDFEVFIDPDGDTHNYYELEINAFGTIWDLFLNKPYRDGGQAITGWDIRGLKAGIDIDGIVNNPEEKDKKWTVEIAMPWSILKECSSESRAPKNDEQWRINFSRVEWQTNIVDGKYEKKINPETNKPFPPDNWVWSPQGVINMHYPEMWGFLQFSDKIAGTGKDNFVFNKNENIKWALRQLYYKELEFKKKYGCYTDDTTKLKLEEIKVTGFEFKPIIQITNSLFEITLQGFDGKTQWHIREDGKTWKD